MANYIATDTDLESVADAIRTKGGTSADLVFPQGFVDAIDAIETGGGGYSIDGIAMRTEPSGSVTINANQIKANAFNGCASLTAVNAPNATYVGDGAFAGCSALKTIKLPRITSVGTNAFTACNLTGAVYLPVLRTTSSYSFRNNKLLTVFVAPALQTFGTGTFALNNSDACIALTTIDLTNATNIHNAAAQQCTAFNTLILRKTTVVPLGNMNFFTGTPFASGKAGGTLYVPSALISSYQSATNWSTILGYTNNQILPIEGSIYETQYADGTPIPTT